MAEPPFFSSQGSEYDQLAILQEQENAEPLSSSRYVGHEHLEGDSASNHRHVGDRSRLDCR